MSSGRSIGHLAKRAGLEPGEVLARLNDAGYNYSSPLQQVARTRLERVEALLGIAGRAAAPGGLRGAPSPPRPEPPKQGAAKDEFPEEPKPPKRPRKTTTGSSGPLRHQYDLEVVGHSPSGPLNYLDSNTVIDIHNELVRDFAASPDPIEPPGPREGGALLEAALTRPRTSMGRRMKYPTVEMAAAALLHSLVQGHPFHNGNKRTGIVTMLVFLDQNGYVLHADDSDLFNFVISLAQHRVTGASSSGTTDHMLSDEETVIAAKWVKDHVRKVSKAQTRLKWHTFEKILRRYGCVIEVKRGNKIMITRGDLVAHVGRRNIGADVEVETIAHVRKALELDEEHGIDSESFYYNADVVPEFINKYRQVLKRLAPY